MRTPAVLATHILVAAQLVAVIAVVQLAPRSPVSAWTSSGEGAAASMGVHRNSTIEAYPEARRAADRVEPLARSQGIPAAIAVLDEIEREEGLIPQFSHLVAHHIGHVAMLEHYSDHREALSHCDDRYQFGCLHGVLEAYFERTRPSFEPDRINDVCGPTAQLSSREFVLAAQCIHGLGHVVMARNAHDLFASIPACDALDSDRARYTCHAAVFMANNVQLLDRKLIDAGLIEPDIHSAHPYFFDLDDLNYPCSAVDDQYKGGCYTMLPAGLIGLLRGDLDAVMRGCTEAPAAWVGPCFRSFGREMAGFVQYDAQRAHEVCARAPEVGRTLCYWGAAQNLTTSRRDPADAHPLCRLAAEPHKRDCWASIGQNLHDFYWDDRDRVRWCGDAEPAYVEACLEWARRGWDGAR